MYSFRRLSYFLCLILFCGRVHAASIPLQNLTQDDLNKVVGDLSTNFLHTSVSGAGTLGHIFGFEVGVVGGQTSTPHINEVVHNGGATTVDASKIPNVALLGVLTVPLGITGEIGLLPKQGNSEFSVNTLSLAAKWTATELFFSDLPLSLATKLSYTSTSVDFNQNITGPPAALVAYKYTGKETALSLLASKNLAIFEPYVGIGYVSATGDLSATGSALVFNPAFTSSGSASAKRAGTMWQVGTEIKLLVLKLGVEYTNLFDTSRISGKLSVYF